MPSLLPPLLGLALALVPGWAQGPMRYLHNAPESPSDHRYDYQWTMLREVLERTRRAWGPYELGTAPAMPERRQVEELASGQGRLTVMVLGTTEALERTLLPVRIPVDKDLQGHCVFLIRDGEQGRFSAIRSVKDLAPFRFGLGQGWIDVEILQAAGLQVVTGSDYEGLFDMLAERRFDVFLRSAVEVLDELETRQAQYPSLRIEEGLLLHYPMPMYFWFPRTPEGQRLADRVAEGLRALLAEGAFDRLFLRFQKPKIDRLRLRSRRVLELPNPLLPRATPLADRRLWFDLRRGW